MLVISCFDALINMAALLLTKIILSHIEQTTSP